jgi:hypothetical protein
LLPAVLPAVGVSWSDFQQLTEPGGTSKLLQTLKIFTLKRLASAVQLRPWPPYFQSLSSAPNLKAVPFRSKNPNQACRSLPRILGNFTRLIPNFVGTIAAIGRAAKYAGGTIAKGAEKDTDVVVHLSAATGKKIAHFFEAA